MKSLQAALSGNLEKIVVALLQPAAQFDAQELRTALKVPGEDNCWGVWGTGTPTEKKEKLTGFDLSPESGPRDSLDPAMTLRQRNG